MHTHFLGTRYIHSLAVGSQICVCTCVCFGPQHTSPPKAGPDPEQVLLQEGFHCPVSLGITVCGRVFPAHSPCPGKLLIPERGHLRCLRLSQTHFFFQKHLLPLPGTRIHREHSGSRSFARPPASRAERVWVVYGPCLRHSGNTFSRLTAPHNRLPTGETTFSSPRPFRGVCPTRPVPGARPWLPRACVRPSGSRRLPLTEGPGRFSSPNTFQVLSH